MTALTDLVALVATIGLLLVSWVMVIGGLLVVCVEMKHRIARLPAKWVASVALLAVIVITVTIDDGDSGLVWGFVHVSCAMAVCNALTVLVDRADR